MENRQSCVHEVHTQWTEPGSTGPDVALPPEASRLREKEEEEEILCMLRSEGKDLERGLSAPESLWERGGGGARQGRKEKSDWGGGVGERTGYRGREAGTLLPGTVALMVKGPPGSTVPLCHL